MHQQPRLILRPYPLHSKNELMTYNLYAEDTTKGVTDSIPLRFPCVREGCMTTCYFEGGQMSARQLEEPCSNCGNQSKDRVFLDIGLKLFLEQHHKYIRMNEPLNVELNPIRKEFLFSCSALKNNLLGQLSSYIGGKIFNDMGFGLTPALNSQLLDYPRLNQELEGVMTPALKKRRYLIYSFCKYVPQPHEEKTQLHIFLFLFGEKHPIKARILLEANSGQMCPMKSYLEHSMIGCMGQLNTLIFVVPTPGATDYYVANLSQHLAYEQKILRVVHMREWRDPQGRFNGSLVVDQKTNSIFVIGGFDSHKNDSLEFISCFIRCKWDNEGDRLQFKAEIEKGHRMFQGRVGAFNTGMFNTVFKTPYNEDKIAFRNSTFMLYHFDREYGEQLQLEIASKGEKMSKVFLNVGGGLKDSSIFATGRFSTKKPGIRYLRYDTTSNQNPIINESVKGDVNFPGNNYILIELPFYSTPAKKKFKHHCIVIGGRKDPLERSDRKEDFNNIHFINTQNIEQSTTLTQKFTLSSCLPDMVDQFTAIIQDTKPPGNFYLRATYPLKAPIPIGDHYIHYLALEFGLDTGLFEILPGKVPKLGANP